VTGPDALSHLAADILALSASDKPREEAIGEIVLMVQAATGLEAAGVRLVDGLDFPYYFTRGFDQDFVEAESSLCARDQAGEMIRDSDGNPYLDCMCGNVIAGRTDPSKPFFTRGGSFCSNGTTGLLATTTDADRQTRTRNRCNGEGYESVALMPIRTGGRTYGLLQLNDRRRNMFTPEMIAFFEGVASMIGMLFVMIEAKRGLDERARDVARLVSARAVMLERIAAELERRNAAGIPTPDDSPLGRQLSNLVEEIDRLKGLVPVCCVCKKVRVDGDYWQQIESFIQDRSPARFTHTFCPECAQRVKDSLPHAQHD
jgi:GAF domain-containing protein